jgi:hypothetical protein
MSLPMDEMAADNKKRPRDEDAVEEEPAEKRVAIETAGADGVPTISAARVHKTPPSLQTHSDVDFSKWTLTMAPNGRNKYGNLNWNLKAPEYDGNIFNFHELPTEQRTGDAWSTIVWDFKAENFEGASVDKVKVTFEISDGQEASLSRFDESLISLIEKQSCDVLNQKNAVKRDVIANQHYKSALTPRSETRGPRVKMTFVVRNSNNDKSRMGVMNLFKLEEDGETYKKTPIVARGWDEIQPLIEGHHLRGAKMRATVVRCWTINVMKKEVFPMMEIKEMWVREPKGRGPASYARLSEEQQALMNAMD